MNSIKNNLNPENLLRLFIGLVFLSAGIYRIFNWQQAVIEFSRLNLNYPILIALMMILEIAGGLMLIFNIKTKKVLLVFILFILIALIAAFAVAGKNIISGLGQLFVFSPNPTDVFLHFTYLIILLYLLGKK
ncbi:MAG: DoxX family protein [Candidatus Staskawiczbacteria bacterium]|nr:DoxX family protein [Candidatus Staskawiczbacteria bacterium]